jgi:hypothetical protein
MKKVTSILRKSEQNVVSINAQMALSKKSFLFSIFNALLFFTWISQGHSQSGFILKYSTPLDERPTAAVELPQGGFIILGNIFYKPGIFQALIIKVKSSGDTSKTLKIIEDSASCYISDIVKGDDGNYFATGFKMYSSKLFIWIIKLTSNLEILKDTTYAVNMLSIFNLYVTIDHFRNLLIYGTGGLFMGDTHAYMYKLTQNCDSIIYKFLDVNHSQIVFSCIDKPDFSGYYLFFIGDYLEHINSFGKILSLNYELNKTKIDSIPLGLDLYFNAKNINNHEFVLTGKKHFLSTEPRTDKIGIIRFDTSFTVENHMYLGPDDTISYPGYLHNLDFIDTSSIYIGGTCNQALDDFSDNKSYFMVGKMDSHLNLQWEKYYGGDMYYSLWSILATNDHGCLLLGTSFDYLSQNIERDIMVIKVDSTGSSLPNGIINREQIHSVILYPNPGQEYLIIKSGPQLAGFDFELYSPYGQFVISRKIYNDHAKINTQPLSPGIYFYRIVKNSNLIDCGKWMKF